VCYSSGYHVPDWVEERVETRKGSMDSLTIQSRAFEDERAVRVYLPSRFRRRARYPLLVVHDGDDYLMFSRMMTVLDNLTHRLEIPSMIVAMTNPRDRLVEYADCERHARHLVEEIVPAMEQHFPLVGTPASRGLMGASFGAVASLSAAWRYPGFFGKLLLQSGSFGFTDIGEHHRGPAFDPVVRFVNAFRTRPGRPADRIFVSCGIYESLIYENRSLVPLLQATGMNVRYVEARDGHCWENWRDRMREGLSWLFPGPLWMVYE
ncbi:MAG: alpha/beta hydrolase-fold protein, partial [Planctomycetota bacterium]